MSVYLAFSGDTSTKAPLSIVLNGYSFTLNGTTGYNASADLTIYTYGGENGHVTMAGDQSVTVSFVMNDVPANWFDGNLTIGTSTDPLMASHYGYQSTAYAALGSYPAFGSVSPITARDSVEIGEVDIAQLTGTRAVVFVRLKGDRTNESVFHPTLYLDGTDFAYVSGYSGYDSGKDYTTYGYAKDSYTLPALSVGQVVTLKF